MSSHLYLNAYCASASETLLGKQSSADGLIEYELAREERHHKLQSEQSSAQKGKETYPAFSKFPGVCATASAIKSRICSGLEVQTTKYLQGRAHA